MGYETANKITVNGREYPTDIFESDLERPLERIRRRSSINTDNLKYSEILKVALLRSVIINSENSPSSQDWIGWDPQYEESAIVLFIPCIGEETVISSIGICPTDNRIDVFTTKQGISIEGLEAPLDMLLTIIGEQTNQLRNWITGSGVHNKRKRDLEAEYRRFSKDKLHVLDLIFSFGLADKDKFISEHLLPHLEKIDSTVNRLKRERCINIVEIGEDGRVIAG